MWPGMEALAPTLAYDAAVMGDSGPAVWSPRYGAHPRPGRQRDRDLGSQRGPGARGGAPDAQRRTLDGQAHNVAWDVLAPVLREFLTG